MFPPTDNPAERLLEILRKAQPMENHPITKIFSAVFDIPKMDYPTCYRVLGHLNSLVDSVDTRIRQIEGLNHDLFLRDLPTIRNILCPPNLTTNWHSIKTPLDHGVLTGLEFCANELAKNHSEEKISSEVLSDLKKEFSDLIKDVSIADIPADLKLILFELLTSAVISIDQYRILGNDGLKKTVAYTIGLMTLHKGEFMKAKEVSIMAKVGIAIDHIYKIVATAYKVKEIANGTADVPEFLSLIQ